MNETRIAQLAMGGFYSLCIGIDLWQVRENLSGEDEVAWQQKALDLIRLVGSATWAALWADGSSLVSLGARGSVVKLLCSGAFFCVYGASAFEGRKRDWMYVAGYVSFMAWSSLFAFGVFVPVSPLLYILQLGSCVVGVGCISLSLVHEHRHLAHEKKIIKA